MIFIGDLGQLPLVKDILMYIDTSHGNALWKSFTKVFTLSTIFSQLLRILRIVSHS